MGRKNRNARNTVRHYSSFDEFMSPTVQFDLSKGTFPTKSQSTRQPDRQAEVGISVINGGENQGMCINISFRSDIADTLIKGNGKYFTAGVVKEGGFERFYLVPDPNGYAITHCGKHCTRRYCKIPIDSGDSFKKYEGYHNLLWDNYNKAFYVTISK